MYDDINIRRRKCRGYCGGAGLARERGDVVAVYRNKLPVEGFCQTFQDGIGEVIGPEYWTVDVS